jgi:predicted homoserine dehydrogenase-like protein
VNLHAKLVERQAAGRPVTIGLIGAGKFGTMFLSQVRVTAGMHLVGVADLDVKRATSRFEVAGWPAERHSAASLDEAIRHGSTHIGEDAMALIADPRVEVIIEATGDPRTGIRFCRKAIVHGKHIIMVNVEADALAGPILAREARQAGVVYSLAYGDQPALICEQVDWARTAGFQVVAAGKGTRYHPSYHQSTPDTVWNILDKYLSIEDRQSINPKMFNSFIDGTKSAIEMTAVCNATGLKAQSNGLKFPPASRFEHAEVCKPAAEGGVLEEAGVTEVTSSVDRNEQDVPHHLAMGTYVVVAAASDYARRCLREYHLLPDRSGKYAALYRPIHMIGLELGISVASAALRGEPTGQPAMFQSDVVATAKRALKSGEMLDGEGGFCVWGKQTPAALSLQEGYLPLGLAGNVRLNTDIAAGERLRWSDVALEPEDEAVRTRRAMEAAFAPDRRKKEPVPD